MENNFKDLLQFVDKMKNTSSVKEKQNILASVKHNEFIKRSLNYTYDPFKRYNLTSTNCIKNKNLFEDNSLDLFQVLNLLNDKTYTGHNAIKLMNGLINRFKEYEQLIFSILDRNLEIRVSETIINKIIPNLIPTFEVALAEKFDIKRVDWNDTWTASRKLDGVRCLTIVDIQGNVKMFSRQGNEFETLQVVKDEIKRLGVVGVVFDGEICLMDSSGQEDFQSIMKEIKRKNHTIKNPKYILFDYLTLTEFFEKKSSTKFIERISRFSKLSDKIENSKILDILKQEVISDDTHFNQIVSDAEKQGFEGVMLRRNVGYEGKRSLNLLKVKKFNDAEYVVLGLDFEDHRVIRDGREITMTMMAQAYIEHKGYKVAVGSGWTQEQRIMYHKNPELIIGKTITVKYFEETKNQKGEYSLRFPVVKYIFQSGRNC